MQFSSAIENTQQSPSPTVSQNHRTTGLTGSFATEPILLPRCSPGTKDGGGAEVRITVLREEICKKHIRFDGTMAFL